MTETPQITIPADLLPRDGRFGAGPSKVRPEQVEALAAIAPTYLGTSHRQKTVKSQVGRLRAGLADLFSLPEGYEVVLGNGGSTAFWDVATFGLIRDRAQFLTFGEFGSKFAAAVKDAPFLGEPDRRARPTRAARRPSPPRPASTSTRPRTTRPRTGVAITPTRVAGADADALMLFDATSGAGGLAVDQAESDVYYFAPQKCFASDGGLWFALMSPKAIERAAEIKASGRYIPAFLDLQTAIDNSRLDQTYNTPALATILLMAEQVDWFNANGGLDWTRRAHHGVVRRALRLGRGVGVHHAVRHRPGAALAGHRHHRLRRRDRRRPRSRRCCAPTASSTPSPTASSAATSCASRCSRRSTPTTCAA